jgi:subtilisin family serine protease
MGPRIDLIVRMATLACVVILITLCASAQKRGDYVPGELLVKYASSKISKARTANQMTGASVLENVGDTGLQRVKLPPSVTLQAAIARYQSLDDVEYAQPNFYYHLLNTPNDPQFSSATMYGLFKIGAPTAWDLSTGSSSVVVADIDTGMRYTHDDLAANAWHNPGEIPNNGIDDDGNGFIDDYYGWDFRFNDSDPIDLDAVPGAPGSFGSSGHGTHTAGTIGAVGNNLVGVVGINWNVQLMTIKIFNNNVSDDTTTSQLVAAYDYIRMMRNRGINIRVTSNSYGGCTEACGFDAATKQAIDALGDAGVLNVFAAGNSNTNNDASPFYPANYDSPSIIAVAASDSSDVKAGFSSYGATTVDLAAPGVGILSTSPPNTYGNLSGTSMATPHVAGGAALLAAYQPGLSMESLKATILNNVDVLANWNGVVKTGGRLNVFRTLQNPTVCTFAPSTIQPVSSAGGNSAFTVTAQNNCDYMPESNAAWITITNTASLSGNGTVTYSVAQNNTGANRSAQITFGGNLVTINQAGLTTAARVGISGRVINGEGSGIRGAAVLLIDRQANVRRTLTNAFGYYRFDGVRAGSNYVIRTASRGYSFSSRVVDVNGETVGINFTDGK